VTKTHDQRIKLGLERMRAKLKLRELELIGAERTLRQERDEFRRERADLVALLQVLTEQYGDPDWDNTTPLVQVVERNLIDPIMASVARLRARSRAPRAPETSPVPAPTPPPEPARRLREVPPSVHRVMVVEAESGVARGRSCRCTCGWVSRILPTEAECWRAAAEHEGERARLRQAAR
jgi:hypothetical protein